MALITLLGMADAGYEFLNGPYNLKVNGETDSVAESCYLTWSAAETEPDDLPIYYRLLVNNSFISETIEGTSYTLSNPESYTSRVPIRLNALVDGDEYSAWTNTVYYTYQVSLSCITNPSNLLVNDLLSDVNGVCTLTWDAAVFSPSNGTTITYEIYIDNASSSSYSTTNTHYTIPSSVVKNWTSEKTIKVRAKGTREGRTVYSGYTNNVYYTFTSNLRLLCASGFNNSPTSNSVNSSSQRVGGATASAKYGVYLKFQKPVLDWNTISTMTLHIYRTEGTARGRADFNAPPVSWPASNTGLSYTTLYNMHNDTSTDPNGNKPQTTQYVEAVGKWSQVDISSIITHLKNRAGPDYIVLGMISKGTYMFVNTDPDSNEAPYITIS